MVFSYTVSYLFQAKLITKIDITKIDISQIEMKGRKKISDASKRLRGTDQPCRMDGELVPMTPGTTDPESLKGCACWGGLDLSNVSDITAFVLIFHENDMFQLLPFFWIPEEKMLEKIKKENINYDRWNSSQTIIDLQNEGNGSAHKRVREAGTHRED